MRAPATTFILFLCLMTVGAQVVADPPNRVPFPPPSALITIADQLSIQPGQEVNIPVDVNGWQNFTIFVEALLPPQEGNPDDSTRCVSDYQLNGLGDNLAQIPNVFSPGAGACVSTGDLPPGVPHKWLESGALFGPKFVLTMAATANLGTPARVTVLLYLH